MALPAALFAYQSHQLRVWAEQHPGGVCGMGMFAAIALSALLSIGLSALALLLGWLDHREWRRPLSLRRAIELLLVGAVCEAALVACAAALVANAWD